MVLKSQSCTSSEKVYSGKHRKLQCNRSLLCLNTTYPTSSSSWSGSLCTSRCLSLLDLQRNREISSKELEGKQKQWRRTRWSSWIFKEILNLKTLSSFEYGRRFVIGFLVRTGLYWIFITMPITMRVFWKAVDIPETRNLRAASWWKRCSSPLCTLFQCF